MTYQPPVVIELSASDLLDLCQLEQDRWPDDPYGSMCPRSRVYQKVYLGAHYPEIFSDYY